MNFNLNYQFKNPALLEIALTHRSFLNENRHKKLISNERLEFLGDAVLELIVSTYLFQLYPKSDEGKLTSLRAKLVQTKTLAQASQKLNLGQFLKLSKGEKDSGGAGNPTILANTFEALVGAIYQDGGFDSAFAFVQEYLFLPIKIQGLEKLPQDYKSELQELVQAKGYPAPEYQLLFAKGPDHHKIFKVGVLVNKRLLATAQGLSKQEAEQQSAKIALPQFGK